ncbi:uncharacterized protein JCM6883_002239 [Sporobolomyces salmoneus]|uniref:uncharacterized protein n=1 Tax=Sporobolomyces salmoneus TaxID=183962 RepID=UPI00318026EA
MSSTAAASTSPTSFHFSSSTANGLSPANLSPSPASPVSTTSEHSPRLSQIPEAPNPTQSPQSDVPTPLFDRPPSSTSANSNSGNRPNGAGRSASYKNEQDIWGGNGTSFTTSSPNGTQSYLTTGGAYSGGAVGESSAQRTTRAASDGLLLGSGFNNSAPSNGFSPPAGRMSSLGSDDSSEEQAMFREHQRKSLESSATARLVNSIHNSTSTSTNGSSRSFASSTSPSTSPFFTPLTMSSSATSSALPPLLSPTSQSPPSSARPPPTAAPTQPGLENSNEAKGATLHLGDLDVWMDEQYVRECCKMMGWDNVTGIKMSRGASPSSGYCFITFPSPAEASRVLARFNASPPMLMPRSGRTFKLNWGTGVPGSAPKWEGEWSVFVGDLAREVGEQELMGLFTPLFPSTKSAKVMTDPSSGLSRGYGFVRFGEESDMSRALSIGLNPNSGLLLHGRTIRISEATGGANGTPGLLDVAGGFKDRERARTRTASESTGLNAAAPGYFPPYPPASQSHEYNSPNGQPDLNSSPYPPPFSPSLALSPNALQFGPPGGMSSNNSSNSALSPSLRGPMSPSLGSGSNSTGGREGGPVRQPIPAGAVPPGGDPNNTTVFVGGLPACISEETLKSFFQHFGEITYCKIPTGKGCGFVQFVKRQDAELAIAKMNDFPIHGKSRIRLSWGRSQGDKQVEHVRKLASALGVPFDAVWRMVQGQDNSTIKQIASAVGGPAGATSAQTQQQQAERQSAANAARMDLRAVANAAGLTEAEVLDLVKSGNPGNASGPSSSLAERANSGSTSNENSLLERSGNSDKPGMFSRSGPNSFPSTQQQQHSMLPLSPPPSAGPAGSFSQIPPPAAHAHAHAHAHNNFANPYGPPPPPPHASGPFHIPPPHAGFAPHPPSHNYPQPQLQHPSPSPYNAIRPDAYVVHSPNTNPYERVDFAEGGRPTPPLPRGPYDQGPGPAFANSNDHYANSAPPPPSNGLEDSFASMSFGNSSQPPRTLPPPRGLSFSNGNSSGVGSPSAPDFFPSALGSPTTTKFEIPAESSWSWNNMGTGHA